MRVPKEVVALARRSASVPRRGGPSSIFKIKTFFGKKTGMTFRFLSLTDRPPKPDEIEMEGEAFFFGDERNHPRMGLFRVQPLRNEAEAFPDSKDMGIHGEGLSSQTEKKKAG
jgi:hypothetical protein